MPTKPHVIPPAYNETIRIAALTISEQLTHIWLDSQRWTAKENWSFQKYFQQIYNSSSSWEMKKITEIFTMGKSPRRENNRLGSVFILCSKREQLVDDAAVVTWTSLWRQNVKLVYTCWVVNQAACVVGWAASSVALKAASNLTTCCNRQTSTSTACFNADLSCEAIRV